MSILTLENVCFKYDAQSPYALKNVSFSVEKGEFLAVIGHNGSGKSTLAKLFNGLLIPQKGEVRVDGICTSDKKTLFDLRKKVGVVFQNPDNQLISSIVEDDIAFGAENIGLNREEIGKRIDFALKSVGMENERKSSPSRLSGGQKQRIAIAGVLALMPEILVLDESTAMLDPKGREEVMNVVASLNRERKMTVILITHYMEETVAADKILVMDNGETAFSGTPEEVFAQKERLERLSLTVPPCVEIADRLKELGVPIKGNPLTKEVLAEELCRLSAKI